MIITKIVISIIIAFVISQTIKSIDNYRRTGKLDLISFFLQNGGMPSSHTATSVALSISILIETGFSYFFIICTLFTAIVVNDSMKVRLETGEEAKVLNIIIEKEKILHKKLTERVGHTPQEVLVGVIVGVTSSFIVYIL